MNRRLFLGFIAWLTSLGFLSNRASAKSSSEVASIVACSSDSKRWLNVFSGMPGTYHMNTYTLWERAECNGLCSRSTYLTVPHNITLALFWNEVQPVQRIALYFRPDGSQCEFAEYEAKRDR